METIALFYGPDKLAVLRLIFNFVQCLVFRLSSKYGKRRLQFRA